MLTNSNYFDPRVIKLQTKIRSESGQEETACAIVSDNTHVKGVSLVKIVSENELKSTLAYMMKKDTPNDRYRVFARESFGQGYMRFSFEGYELELMSSLPQNDINNAARGKIYLSNDGKYIVRDIKGIAQAGCFENKFNDNLVDHLKDEDFVRQMLETTSRDGHTFDRVTNRCPYLYIDFMTNTSKYSHVGAALHEFALRYSLMSGKQGRIQEDASWSSHLFHRKCGYSPGDYTDTQEERIKKENAIDERIRGLQEIYKTNGNKVDTKSLGGVHMYLCKEQIAEKKKQFGILSDELAIPPENFVTASEYLGLKLVPVESKEASKKEEKIAKEEPKAVPAKEEKLATQLMTDKKEEMKPAPFKFLTSPPSADLLKCLPASLLEVNHSYIKMGENKEDSERVVFVIDDVEQAVSFNQAIAKLIGEQNVQINYDINNKSYITVEHEAKKVLKHLRICEKSTEFLNPFQHDIQRYAQERLHEKEYRHAYGRLFGQSKSVKLAASLLALAYPEKTFNELSQDNKIQKALSNGLLGEKMKAAGRFKR